MASIFFTGFPGFLGSELLPRVLRRAPDAEAICLVQSKFAPLARERAEQIASRHPEVEGRIRIVEGDITTPWLGVEAQALHGEVTEIYHLAAIYDLSVAREPAMRVNVDGTRNVLDFAERCGSLQRVQYVSTCYVSGRYDGVFREGDLQKGQQFNNFYEETKFLAEVEVQERMRAGMPSTIYRPSVVVGDSRTGATQKYDGPYYVIQWLLRQPRVAVMPVIGRTREHRLNVVPSDYVVDAITHLSGREEAAGQVYQLADPNPLDNHQMLEVLARATGRTLIRLPLPLGLAKLAIDRVPGVYPVLRIPSSAIDYFVHPARYDTSRAERDLSGTGIEVPSFRDYAERLVEFVRQHPAIPAAGLA
jgi:thioester reductase-like protein